MSQSLHSHPRYRPLSARVRARSGSPTPNRAADVGERPQDPGAVVFATQSVQPSVAGLCQAQALTEQLHARLLLLSVVPTRALRPRFIGDEPTALQRFVEVARTCTGHARAILQERYAEERHALKVGSFFEQTCRFAREVGATLIVLSEREQPGSRVAALVRASGCPVLVVRPPVRPYARIVAATDLKCAGFPVLQRACELRPSDDTAVLCVHHTSEAHTRRLARARLLGAGRAARQRKRRAACRTLAEVCQRVGAEVELTPPSPDPAQATLQFARRVGADLIVVGTGVRSTVRSTLTRPLRRSIAASVVDGSTCSVLVTPRA